jgi:WD40 repeat protein
VVLWDVDTGKPLSAYRDHARGVTRVAFSPDGRRLASGDDTGGVCIRRLPAKP